MNDIQKIILDIFKNVSQVLDANGIEYFAIGGTCLGAARHKGFIPWDDDLDIAIPIENYQKSIDLMKAELPDYYEIRTGEGIEHYGNIFMKVFDKRTTLIEKKEYRFPDAYKGVFIDIMPISGMPGGKLARDIFCRKVNFFRIMNEMRRFGREEQDLSWKKRLWPVLHAFDGLIKYDFFARRWMSMLKKYNFYGSRYTGYTWWWDVKRLTYDFSVFDGTVSLPFEDTFIKCPAGYDKMLSVQFGNYMDLPPEKERVAMHDGTVDLDSPYSAYKSGKLKLK